MEIAIISHIVDTTIPFQNPGYQNQTWNVIRLNSIEQYPSDLDPSVEGFASLDPATGKFTLKQGIYQITYYVRADASSNVYSGLRNETNQQFVINGDQMASGTFDYASSTHWGLVPVFGETEEFSLNLFCWNYKGFSTAGSSLGEIWNEGTVPPDLTQMRVQSVKIIKLQ